VVTHDKNRAAIFAPLVNNNGRVVTFSAHFRYQRFSAGHKRLYPIQNRPSFASNVGCEGSKKEAAMDSSALCSSRGTRNFLLLWYLPSMTEVILREAVTYRPAALVESRLSFPSIRLDSVSDERYFTAWYPPRMSRLTGRIPPPHAVADHKAEDLPAWPTLIRHTSANILFRPHTLTSFRGVLVHWVRTSKYKRSSIMANRQFVSEPKEIDLSFRPLC